MEKMHSDLVICNCGSSEHQIIFTYNEDEKEVYMEVHLSKQRRFFKRFWHALKYIFGYRCRYGDFEEVIITPEDADKFLKIYNFLKN